MLSSTPHENLARYIIRAFISREGMQYLNQEGKVVYTFKEGKSNKVFPALEWFATMCSQIPNKGEQMTRYCGFGITIRHFISIGNLHFNSKLKTIDK